MKQRSRVARPDKADEARGGRRGVRIRAWAIALLLLGGAGKVMHRAYQIQLQNPESYERHYREEIEIETRRGTIYDRRGAELAVSVELDSFFADPVALRNNHQDPTAVAAKVARVLNVDAAQLAARLAGKRRFVWLKRRASPSESQAMAELGLFGKGVGARKEPRRYYPGLATAAHVLGFTDDEGRGVEGVERAFETRLHGATDKVAAILDARGGVVFSEELVDGQAAQGKHLTLTLDRELQIIAERELELGVRAVEARAGHVVVMDPSSGEILALANYPSFNPNQPGAADPSARRNRALTDRFEPGSVIKAFTVAGALSSGVVSPTQRIDCEDGAMQVAEYTIHDSHRFQELTPAEILAHSSNIGTAKIGAALGRAGLFRALRRFGFGARTELELPAEAEGILRHYKRWYDMDAATISFGQGMSVTSVQLAAAMAAIANGGRLMKPYLVSRVSDAEGNTVEEFSPTVRRQVVPAHVARLVGDMLTAVTADGGTGEAAALDGYLVAGKTGTAQKADYTRGGYAEGQWVATFVGFVPAERPRLTISVVIDEPVIDHYGGTVAGPVFRRVAEASLRHLGVAPAHGGAKLSEIVKRLRADESVQASANPELGKKRAAGGATPKGDAQTEGAQSEEVVEAGQVRVPDLSGKGARAALVLLRNAGLSGTLSGSGAVTEQAPEAGTRVASGALIQLVLRRPAPSAHSEHEPARPAVSGGAASKLAIVEAVP
jgi:cell division protein FtsI (penicillin-binding protein 3)